MPTKKKKSTTKKTTTKKRQQTTKKPLVLVLIGLLIGTALCLWMQQRSANATIDTFHAQPYSKVKPLIKPKAIKGQLTPSAIKSFYNFAGTTGGSGTIAIVDAFDNPQAEADLGTFSTQYGLPACTTANGCFTKVKIGSPASNNQGWALETSLDIQWAHAMAPSAKILLVEARSDSGSDLLNAVDYARKQPGVVAVSMSWGGDEFSTQSRYDSYFTSSTGIVFFAASGDSGSGTSWPAISSNVVSVGGTSLRTDSAGNIVSETAWSGSGGGLSRFNSEPIYQLRAGIPSARNKRGNPDVSYNADPASGYPVYSSYPYNGYTGWFQVGGTSAGSPQWAALKAINPSLNLSNLYQTIAAKSLRDITSGTNGFCSYYCSARAGFDYVTGLGSPRAAKF